VLGSGSMSNILEVPQQQAIQALIAKGWSVRRIARTLGINRRTVKRYADAAPKVHHPSDRRLRCLRTGQSAPPK
jgi:DNA invertase Pin-like site-specific DNA recombinase